MDSKKYSDIFWMIIDNADSFSKRTNVDKPEFGWAKQVNLSLAIELYIKAIMNAEGKEIKHGHNLRALFRYLDNKTQHSIFQNWRALAGENIPNDKETKTWFNDSLYGCSKIFDRFRYVHEWAGSNVSLQSSWDNDQFRKLHPASAEREIGTPQVSDSFLKQFENAIKKYIKENVIPTLPPRSYDFQIACQITIEMSRPSKKRRS